MLTVFGSINIDQVLSVTSIPLPGETVLGKKILEGHGGKGANQAVAAARVANGHFTVRFVGALGHDEHGEAALANLKANGVLPICEQISGVPTGTALIAIDNTGENAITVLPGANDRLRAENFTSAIQQETEILLCQGEVDIDQTFGAFAVFKKHKPNGVTILNLAPVPMALCSPDLKMVDLLVVNEKEAADVQAILEQDLPSIAAILSLGIIVTRGAEGAVIHTAEADPVIVESPRVSPSDTTGAGDTFCGVLAALLTEGWTLHDAAEMACKAGAIACLSIGAQSGMPTRDILTGH